MRIPAALILLSLALAGCSGGGDDGGSPPSAALSGTTTSTGPPLPPVPTTDTIHLLQGPDATTLPSTGGDLRTPVGFGDGGPDGQQASAAQWRYQVQSATNVTGGEVRIWIEVLETLVHFPSTPLQPQCTWTILTQVGADMTPLVSCLSEAPGPINPGVRELSVTLVFDGDVELEANETVSVTLQRSGFSASANNAVDALSGSMEHDSRIVLKGLREPIRA
jgi:hypothetical protein